MWIVNQVMRVKACFLPSYINYFKIWNYFLFILGDDDNLIIPF